jgi:hypothetical protein
MDLDDVVCRLYEAKEEGDFEPTPWEDDFIDDMYAKVDALEDDDIFVTTDKQAGVINDLYAKYLA